jgi:hypothetical protein
MTMNELTAASQSRNKRASDRLNERGTIFIEMLSSADPTTAPSRIVICNSRDISANGLCVRIDDEIAVGALLRLGVELKEIDHTLYLVGQVMHCTPIASNKASGHFEVGFDLIESSGTDIQDWRALIHELQ